MDENGYWIINGQQILDSNQKPIKAEGKTTSLITKVEMNDNGTASITLGNGEILSVSTFTLFNVEWEGMRRRIKPIVVYVVLALLGLALVIANIHNTSKQQAHLEKVKSAIPSATTPKTTTSSTSDSSDEELILNPIIDLSGWQLPQDIDYDVLSN